MTLKRLQDTALSGWGEAENLARYLIDHPETKIIGIYSALDKLGVKVHMQDVSGEQFHIYVEQPLAAKVVLDAFNNKTL